MRMIKHGRSNRLVRFTVVVTVRIRIWALQNHTHQLFKTCWTLKLFGLAKLVLYQINPKKYIILVLI